MVELKRRKDPKSYFLVLGIGAGGLLTSPIVRSTAYPFLWVGFLVFICLALWVRFGKKPAAWVRGEALYLLNGIFSPLKLVKSEICKLDYVKQSSSEYVLVAKFKNDTSQNILIHNKDEHLYENRLVNFINDHFFPVEMDHIEASNN